MTSFEIELSTDLSQDEIDEYTEGCEMVLVHERTVTLFGDKDIIERSVEALSCEGFL